MTYETAKRLKEAGFPQGGNGNWIPEKPKKGIYNSGDILPIFDAVVYIPISDELIRELGERFGYLAPLRDPETSKIVGYTAHDFLASKVDGFSEGHEPDEALAELYIATRNGK